MLRIVNMFVAYLLSIMLLMSCSNNVILNTGYDIIVAPPDVREQAVWYAKKYIEAGAQFGLFASQAFKNASEIVLQARKIKDKILAETDIDIIESMQEAFCK